MTPATTGPVLIPVRSSSEPSVVARADNHLEHVERHPDHGLGVVGARARHAGGGHVAVADRLDLLEPVVDSARSSKCREQLVEDADDLGRVIGAPRTV